MNLYKLTQTVNTGYDTHDSVIVVAVDEEQARTINPDGYRAMIDRPLQDEDGEFSVSGTWGDFTWAPTPAQVSVELIGEAAGSYDKPTVILASFNAG